MHPDEETTIVDAFNEACFDQEKVVTALKRWDRMKLFAARGTVQEQLGAIDAVLATPTLIPTEVAEYFNFMGPRLRAILNAFADMDDFDERSTSPKASGSGPSNFSMDGSRDFPVVDPNEPIVIQDFRREGNMRRESSGEIEDVPF